MITKYNRNIERTEYLLWIDLTPHVSVHDNSKGGSYD